MPEFLPFRGVRYTSDDLSAVTAPPYDVIDDDERAALARRHERNAVRLILPEGPPASRYDGAAALLAEWQAARFLTGDPAARFYGYRMQFTDDRRRARTTHGVLGALTLPAIAGDGDVLPHERTLPKAKSDRLALLRATRANLDPIWGLSPGEGLGELGAAGAELGRAVDDLGVEHTITAIDDPGVIRDIAATVRAAPLVLADGHHRFETAIAYRDEQRGREAERGTSSVLCLVVELAEAQLWVQPIHRLLAGLPGGFDLRAALAPRMRVEDVGPNTPEDRQRLVARMEATHGLGLVDTRGVAVAVPEDASVDVDAAVFERDVTPALPKGVDVTYRNDAATVASLVEKGAAGAAVLLRPVTVGQIRAAADARVRMPQKTTFFAPKPRTGMVFRLLDT